MACPIRPSTPKPSVGTREPTRPHIMITLSSSMPLSLSLSLSLPHLSAGIRLHPIGLPSRSHACIVMPTDHGEDDDNERGDGCCRGDEGPERGFLEAFAMNECRSAWVTAATVRWSPMCGPGDCGDGNGEGVRGCRSSLDGAGGAVCTARACTLRIVELTSASC